MEQLPGTRFLPLPSCLVRMPYVSLFLSSYACSLKSCRVAAQVFDIWSNKTSIVHLQIGQTNSQVELMATRSGRQYGAPVNKDCDDLLSLIAGRVDELEARLLNIEALLLNKGKKPDEESSLTGMNLNVKEGLKNQEPEPFKINSKLQTPFRELANEFLRIKTDVYDAAGDITKRVRINVPDFDGRIDPKVFEDWLATLELYFDWYDIPDEKKVRSAIMELIGQVQIWWTGVEYDMQLAGQGNLSKDELKLGLQRKYLPQQYQIDLYDDLTGLKQGGMTVIKYMNKFQELQVRCRGPEIPQLALSLFKQGLRPEIRNQMIPHKVYSVDDAF